MYSFRPLALRLRFSADLPLSNERMIRFQKNKPGAWTRLAKIVQVILSSATWLSWSQLVWL